MNFSAPITISPTIGEIDYDYRTAATNEYQQPAPQSYTSPTPSLRYETNGRTSQQSRRGSLLQELQPRRLSQQSITGGGSGQPIEVADTKLSSALHDSSVDKYAKDSFETEKSKSNRTSPISDELQPVRRRSSIRFSDDVQLSTSSDSGRFAESNAETTSHIDSGYSGKQYQESVQEYNQPATIQDTYSTSDLQQSQQQQEPLYTQQDYTSAQQYDQSGNVYSADDYEPQYTTEQYDTSQYTSAQQPEYVGSDATELQQQYDTSQPQQQQQYDDSTIQQYQPTYDASVYDQSYASTEQRPQTTYDTEKYSIAQYRDENNGSRLSGSIQQQQQQQPQSSTFTSNPESISSNPNLGQKYRGNGNTQQQQQQQQQLQSQQQQQQQQFAKQTRPLQKQPPKKKY